MMEKALTGKISVIKYVSCKWCDSDKVVRNGNKKNAQGEDVQHFLCRTCGRSFVDNGCLPMGRFKPEDIAGAVYDYYTGSSLNDIIGSIKQRTGKDVSDAGVYKWITKYTKIALDKVKDDVPKVGNTWVADETVIKVAGQKYWCVVVIDQETRFILGTRIARSRTARDIQLAFERAKQRAGKSPKVVLTDGYVAYPEMVGLVFGEKTQHVLSHPFEGKNGEDTNVVERFNSSLKEKHKVSRNYKNLVTAHLNLQGWIFYYDYLRGHEGLDGKTPAQVCGLKSPFQDWQGVVFSQKPPPMPIIKPVNITYRKRRNAKPKTVRPITPGIAQMRRAK
jgi:transposase-like protein